MRSDKNVYGVARFKIHEGQEEAFRAIVEELSAATAEEEGALGYEWSLSEDGRTCHVVERYLDSDAMRVHMEKLGTFSDRFFPLVDIVSIDIYGSPDTQLREAFSQFGAKFHQPYAGFVR